MTLSSFPHNHRPCIKMAMMLLTICWGCTPKGDGSAASSASDSPKHNQYFVHGEQLYLSHCSNCHQPSGTGLGLVYPPLNGSDYLRNNFESVLCLMKHGISGELTVNGNGFNQPMPGIPTLTDLEIAEIATYVYNTWGGRDGIIDVQEVSKIMKECDGE